jgi:hypothetical protein
MPLRSPCVNSWGSDEEPLYSNVTAINIVPFLLSMIFIRIRVVNGLKSDFMEALVQAILHCVAQASLQVANLDISLCVWFWS